jgi:peptide/nickel transport system substrate-binding protein
VRKLFACVVAAVMAATAAPSQADTPRDALVMAWTFDDIISLDPAEIFEFSAAEYAGNTYDRLIAYDVDDVSNLYGEAVESWTISDDGKTFTFKMRPGITFASGNPMTAEDAVFSLQRAVILDKSPAFILTQFGFTADNVMEKIRATDEMTFVLETDKAYAPTLVLYCLTSTIASVVDKKLVMEHAQNDDLGYEWLKTNYAGSGAFKLRQWKANESLVLDANEDYWGGAPAMKRVIIRHIAESATQQLLLEKGDIDIARSLGPDQLETMRKNPDVYLQSARKGGIYYLGLNQKHEALSKPKVRQALKYLIDYEGMEKTVVQDLMIVHQAFLPVGLLGALEAKPFHLDVGKAKQLLAEAGYPDGFKVTMDTRSISPIMEMAQSIQATFAQAGVELEIIPGDGSQTLTKYRARNHDIYIGRWGPDYQDPHTNADTFARNPDNSDDAQSKPLAWRNAWDIPEMTKEADAAMLESDPAKRAAMYREIQKVHQAISPFVIMYQQTEVAAIRKDTKGFIMGPAFDDNLYHEVTKE